MATTSYYNSALTGQQIENVLEGVRGVTGVVKRTGESSYAAASAADLGAVGYSVSQSLTTAQKTQARTNIGLTNASSLAAVSYGASQSLTSAQKTQVLSNIGLTSASGLSAVSYGTSQSLSTTQQTTAKTNIGLTDADGLSALSYSKTQSLTDAQKSTALANLGLNTELLDALDENVAATLSGEITDLQNGKEDSKIIIKNLSVTTSMFSETNVYEDFPYTVTIPISSTYGIVSTMIPEVVLGVVEASSGTYAPLASSGSNCVYMYASEIPDDGFTIPLLYFWEGE